MKRTPPPSAIGIFRRAHFALAYITLIASTISASPSSAKDSLDTASIHSSYMEGDFDLATEKLENALSEDMLRNHADSVFAFKHLGVMYTARYETREKGKQYMLRLLEVEPTAKIMDMYASDMIYMIFKTIQDEYLVSKARLKRAEKRSREKDALALTDTSSPGSASSHFPQAEPRHHIWVAWTLGSTAVAAVGIILAWYYWPEKPIHHKDNVLP